MKTKKGSRQCRRLSADGCAVPHSLCLLVADQSSLDLLGGREAEHFALGILASWHRGGTSEPKTLNPPSIPSPEK